MTDEQSKENLSRVDYPLHYALADKLGVEVEPFDTYQGPYVAAAEGRLFLSTAEGRLFLSAAEVRLFLSTEDGVLCTWFNDHTKEQSYEFFVLHSVKYGWEPAIRASNAAAQEIVKFPKMIEWDVILSKEYRVSGVFKIQAPNDEAARRLVNELMDQPDEPLQMNDPRIEWNDEHDYIDNTFQIDDVQ